MSWLSPFRAAENTQGPLGVPQPTRLMCLRIPVLQRATALRMGYFTVSLTRTAACRQMDRRKPIICMNIRYAYAATAVRIAFNSTDLAQSDGCG